MGSIQNSFVKLATSDGHPAVRHVDSGMDTARKMFEKWAANEGHPLVRHADGSYTYFEVVRYAGDGFHRQHKILHHPIGL